MPVNIVLHVLFWVLVFTGGVFQLINVPLYYVNMVLVPGTVFLLVLERLYVKRKIKLPHVKYFFAFVLIATTSALINNANIIQFVAFILKSWVAYFYYIVLANTNNPQHDKQILKTAKILVIIQLPAILLKYLTLGISEKGGIGTLSLTSGSLSTVFPSFVIIILLSIYVYNKKKILLYLIGAFVLMGVVGNKRALILFVPMAIFCTYIIHFLKQKKLFSVFVLRQFIVAAFLSICFVYITVRALPTLNPDNTYWGRFDAEYVVDYVTNYTDIDKGYLDQYLEGTRPLQEMRRKDALLYFSIYVYNQGPISFLFGDGAGKLMRMQQVTGEESTMIELYGVRYGGRMGVIWMYLQVGFLGVVAYFGLFLKLFKKVWACYQHTPFHLAFLSSTVLLFVDSIIYSSDFIETYAVLGLYFLIYNQTEKQEKLYTPDKDY